MDPNRLAIWGTSFGGAHATYAAAVDDRVRCIVSVVGVGDGERWLRCLRREWEWQAFLQELDEDRDQRVLSGQSRRVHPYHIMETTPEGWEFWNETVAANPQRGEVEMPLECADAIIDYKPETVAHEMESPALYVSAELDTLTPLDEQVSLYEESPEPKDYVVIQGRTTATTSTRSPHLSHLLDLSVEWFNETSVHFQSGAAAGQPFHRPPAALTVEPLVLGIHAKDDIRGHQRFDWPDLYRFNAMILAFGLLADII